MGVKFLSGDHHHHHHGDDVQNNPNQHQKCCDNCDSDPQVTAPHCVGCIDDPVAELNEWHQRAEQEIQGNLDDNNVRTSASSDNFNDNSSGGESSKEGEYEEQGNDVSRKQGSDENNDTFDDQRGSKTVVQTSISIENTPHTKDVLSSSSAASEKEKKKLVRMGLNTALAIGLHNFPEGLATFVTALHDPTVGVVLAVAIGIHNIPEGLCVALPIYYATGNRVKAFIWGCLSGISEPIAALLGWAVLANSFSGDAYAILFGLMSGMMVIISLKELIPTAHRYDVEDTVVTYSVIAGMAVIALSLVLFRL